WQLPTLGTALVSATASTLELPTGFACGSRRKRAGNSGISAPSPVGFQFETMTAAVLMTQAPLTRPTRPAVRGEPQREGLRRSPRNAGVVRVVRGVRARWRRRGRRERSRQGLIHDEIPVYWARY